MLFNLKKFQKLQIFKDTTVLIVIAFSTFFVVMSILLSVFIPKAEEIIPVTINILLAVAAFWYTLETHKLFATQSFENTFFELLQLHLKIADSLRYDQDDKVHIGRSCFTAFYIELKEHYEVAFAEAKPSHFSSKEEALEFEKNLIDKAFQNFYQDENRERLGHYFRNLFNLIKFVDNHWMGDKQRYMNLIRAQFSAHEEMIIFYDAQFYSHCYKIALGNHVKNQRFKNLIKEYHLLKDIAVNLFFDMASSEKQRFDNKHFSIYINEFMK